MPVFLAAFALLVTIGVGYLLIKGQKPVIVLLLSGFVLVAVSTALQPGLEILDEKDSSGSRWLDIIGLFENVAGSQLTSVGLIIMAAGGFSTYMNKIGASRALVELLSAPMARIKHPYVLLIVTYFIGAALFMFIPSAAGLAILLMVLLVPVLTAAGITPAAAAAVIATASALPMGPASGTSVLAAKTVGLSPVVYFVQNQLIVAIPTAIAVAVTHYFIQRHYDRRGLESYKPTEVKGDDAAEAGPRWYSIFLVLPIVLLIVFSPLVNDKVELTTVGAFIIVWLLAMICEMIRNRSFKKAADASVALFTGMGKMFGGVVALIIAAQIFAEGLTATGAIDLLVKGGEKLGAGMAIMTVVFTVIVGLVTFLTGSGVGAFSAFSGLVPAIAKGLGGSAPALITPMEFASGLFRSMSPVSGVVIAVAGGVGISPMEVVRRTLLPMIVGAVVMIAASLILL
ncbi:C4-dicarboxylate transporter DcuC [Acidipropionibacterium virtanenii]|uniref:Cryptic C4-dicarboxylate transporter DcuD n=1 Tax=Acidipropionibacterium virtanenii TaxID=2057246 RepID=A0A344UXQ7_9ACTN|nr:C4-dicarboxylate transporter DcuC [Acidipropionibacterium virtanenii]AXE40055.1 Putative cryptic C4-dicarboxylate transporter DcuD [Acidipropionibacterium virtanenii]